MERALDNVDADVKNIYKVDVQTAMRWLRRAWLELPSSSIENCWRHTGLLGSVEGVSTEGLDDELTADLHAKWQNWSQGGAEWLFQTCSIVIERMITGRSNVR